jgi:CoA:oxalate CoA-transferase
MSAPLESLRVIDFGRVLAGPHCTKALRDLGADVIKIEPPAGDIGRVALPHIGDIGLYFVQQNAGKRSLSLEARGTRDRQVALRDGRYHRREFPARDADALRPLVRGCPRLQPADHLSTSRSAATGRRRPGATARPSRLPFNRAHRHPRDPFRRSADQRPKRCVQPRRCLHRAAGVTAVLAALESRHKTGEGQYEPADIIAADVAKLRVQQ